MPKFEVVEEVEETLPVEETPAKRSASLDAFLLGFKVLPQRAAVAISNCFALLTVLTVFWLAMLIVPYEPNTYQLAGLGGYALFVLAINVWKK